MACIISLSTRHFAVQVSDRRASGKPPADKPSIEGEAASSPVFFIAADGVVSIGYAGASHVGEASTDLWLTELLWGDQARRGVSIAGQAAVTRVSDAVHRIRQAISGDVEGAGGLEVLVTGFRRKGDRWLPVNLRVRRRRPKPARTLGRLRLGARQVVVAAVGSPPTLQELAVALQRVAGRGNGVVTADESAAVLAGLVRTVAARDPAVGVDLMTTIVRPPPAEPLACRFSSLHYDGRVVLQKPNIISLKVPRLRPFGTAECSPWVIGQQAVIGPAPFHGGSGLMLKADDYMVMVESGRPAPMIAFAALRPPSP